MKLWINNNEWEVRAVVERMLADGEQHGRCSAFLFCMASLMDSVSNHPISSSSRRNIDHPDLSRRAWFGEQLSSSH